MTKRGERAPQPTHVGRVLHTERVTPKMHRLVLGGTGLDEFFMGDYTDHYVKLQFPHSDVSYPEPFNIATIRAELPREQWPISRTYTVRAWDPAARELTIDFVIHGDRGVAGPWAASARVGDQIAFLGPGGAYAPDPHADRHLLAGDESALPAIAAAVERMPPGAEFHALIEVASTKEEQKVTSSDGRGVVWLHRGEHRVGAQLVDAVRALSLPDGDLQAFVHGEAGFVKELRRYLRMERGVPRERLSISGYWRLGHDEDAWQSTKKEWNAAVEAEQGS